MTRFHSASRPTAWLVALCCLLLVTPIGTLRAASNVLPAKFLSGSPVPIESESRTPAEEECESETLVALRSLRRQIESQHASALCSPTFHAARQVAGCSAGRSASSRVQTEHQLKNGVGSHLRC